MRALLLALLAGLPQHAASVAAPPPEQPSVLFIIADDVGWTESGLLTSIFGPGGLAARGSTFTRAYSAPMCSPSRAMMLAGLWPRRYGVGMNLDPFNLGLPTLPELDTLPDALDASHASALIGKWHLSWAPPFEDREREISGPPRQGFDRWLAGNPATPSVGPGAEGYYGWWRVDDALLSFSEDYAVREQRDTFVHWWAETTGPKLAWLSLSAAHDPWDTPPGYTNASTLRQQYENVISYANGAIADVLSHVDLSTTYVVFVCDNGTPNSVRPIGGEFNHWKFTTYEGGVRVPLVVAGPGITEGAISNRLISLVDLPATALELLGGASLSMVDSRSFANSLGDWAGTPARAFTFSERWSDVYDDQAVIESQWKVRRVDPDGEGPDPSEDHFYFIQFPGAEVPLVPPQYVKDRLRAELASLPPRAP